MVDGLDGALFSLEELRVARDADVNGDLKVILLLTDERIVRHGDVETLVCVNAISQRRSATNHVTFLSDLFYDWLLKYGNCIN